MEKKKIAVIGAGNMGGAIVDGLIHSGFADAQDIFVGDRRKMVLDEMEKKGIKVSDDNIYVARQADVVILGVKPYQMESVLDQIKPVLDFRKILVSIVAGKSLREFKNILGNNIPVFRAMPNTAIALQESLTCISSDGEEDAPVNYVIELFNHLGKTVVIPEEQMAAATVLSSCGIAYALRYIRAATQAGTEIGFTADLAKYITAQTVRGATELIIQQGHHPELEIDKVTTPGGITIAGLNELEHNGFSSAVIRGILASYEKIMNG